MSEQVEKMMAKVRALLDTAESLSESNPEASANYRAKAEDLMRKYRIEEENLIAADPTSVEPITFNIDLCESGNVFSGRYVDLFHAIAVHTGIRATYRYAVSETTGKRVAMAMGAGYESDVRYAEYLFTNARLVFQERIEPKVKPELSDAENCYRLRSAGIERNRIANMLWGASMDSDGAHFHGKVGKLYKEACVARGEDPKLNGRQINAKTFREVYAREFVTSMYSRLREAQNAADSIGGALTLHGRSERVDEAFFTRFPEYRPSTEVAERKECEDCKKTKHESGKCKIHRPRKWTQADEARWQRLHNGATARAASKAGADAAREVELTRSARAKRLGEDTTRTTVREVTGLELEG